MRSYQVLPGLSRSYPVFPGLTRSYQALFSNEKLLYVIPEKTINIAGEITDIQQINREPVFKRKEEIEGLQNI